MFILFPDLYTYQLHLVLTCLHVFSLRILIYQVLLVLLATLCHIILCHLYSHLCKHVIRTRMFLFRFESSFLLSVFIRHWLQSYEKRNVSTFVNKYIYFLDSFTFVFHFPVNSSILICAIKQLLTYCDLLCSVTHDLTHFFLPLCS